MKDLCDTCAKFPRECPWVKVWREEVYEMEDRETLGEMLIHPVVYCTDHEEERR